LKAHAKHLAAVATGSALGGVVRFTAVNFSVYSIPPPFPWGTLAVNVIGSLVIGWLAGWSRAEGRHYLSPEVRLFLMVGFCGGLTTFSFFAWQVIALGQPGSTGLSALYIVSSVGLSLLAVWGGYVGAVRITGRGGAHP
jgi:fluoride exporter